MQLHDLKHRVESLLIANKLNEAIQLILSEQNNEENNIIVRSACRRLLEHKDLLNQGYFSADDYTIGKNKIARIIQSLFDEISLAPNGTEGEIRTFLDLRDHQSYRIAKIGKKDWMIDNFKFQIKASWSYNNNGLKANQYGRLYGWNAAINKICPVGWRIPSLYDWSELFNSYDSIIKLRAMTGLELKLGGKKESLYHSKNDFSELDYQGYYWTSDETRVGSERGFCYLIDKMTMQPKKIPIHKNQALSCLLIKD